MAFQEAVIIPEWVAIGLQGGRAWRTSLVVTRGGQRSANKNWPVPLGEWSISFINRTRAEIRQIVSMLNVLNGSFHRCRFLDPFDYNIRQIPMLRLTSTTFQIRQRFTYAGSTFYLTVKKPAQNDPSRIVTLGGVPTTDYTINETTGVVTFNSAVATTVSPRYTGMYHVPVYFLTENIAIDYEDPGFYSLAGVRIAEDRNP